MKGRYTGSVSKNYGRYNQTNTCQGPLNIPLVGLYRTQKHMAEAFYITWQMTIWSPLALLLGLITKTLICIHSKPSNNLKLIHLY